VKRLYPAAHGLAGLLLLAGCYTAPLSPAGPPAPAPTIPPATIPAADTAVDDGWQTLAPGLAQRLITPPQSPLWQMMALRIDPAYFTFRAHYLPGEPLSLAQWRSALPGAVALVNANFFTPEWTINGLLVTDGLAYGTSYTDRGGMFSVQGGVPRLQSLLRQPYQGEALEQAVQAFPMLVLDGQAAHRNENQRRPSRRTVIAQDSAGRILLLATPLLGGGLYDLSAYLPAAGLDVVTALNLDGGGSTMLFIGPSGYEIPSLDPVPAVLAVYPR
jgi:hypothetical protein